MEKWREWGKKVLFPSQSSVLGMELCVDTAELQIPILSKEEISTDEQQIRFSTRITPALFTPAPRGAQPCPQPSPLPAPSPPWGSRAEPPGLTPAPKHPHGHHPRAGERSRERDQPFPGQSHSPGRCTPSQHRAGEAGGVPQRPPEGQFWRGHAPRLPSRRSNPALPGRAGEAAAAAALLDPARLLRKAEG